MTLSHSPNIVRDGLVLYLDAANPKSYPGTGTSWYDLSGNNNNFTLYNSPSVSGGAMVFDGVNQYASIATNFGLSLLVNFTIDIMFKMSTLPVSLPANNEHVFGGQRSNNVTVALGAASGGTSKINMCYDDSGSANYSNYGLAADQWVNFSNVGTPYNDGTYNVGKLKLFVNGKVDRDTFISGDSNGTPWSNSNYIAWDTRWNTYSNLSVSTVKIYNRALSDTEISQNFNALRGRYGI